MTKQEGEIIQAKIDAGMSERGACDTDKGLRMRFRRWRENQAKAETIAAISPPLFGENVGLLEIALDQSRVILESPEHKFFGIVYKTVMQAYHPSFKKDKRQAFSPEDYGAVWEKIMGGNGNGDVIQQR